MQEFYDNISQFLVQSPDVTYQIVISLLAIFVLWLIRFITMRIINRNIDDKKVQYKWRKNLTYILALLGILIVGRVWFEGLGSIATFLGLLSAGLAIALKDPISDLAGWVFIIWEKPFQVGDRIQIGEVKGDVIDNRIFKFTVLEIGNWVHADQSTGRVVHVPNHMIFTESLANYTSDFEFIWNEIPVLITFESNWKKAKEVLLEIVEEHLKDFINEAERQVQDASRSYLIYYQNLTPIVYTDVQDSGVNLTIRHLCNPRERRGLSEKIWEDILEQFNRHEDLEFAYPTMRIHRDDK